MNTLNGKHVTITSCHHVDKPGNVSSLIDKTGVVIEQREGLGGKIEYLVDFDHATVRTYYSADQFTVNDPPSTAIINNILKAYYNGEPLTDAELIDLHAHMIQTAEMLCHLGDRFHLAMVECNHISGVLNGYIISRGLKIKERKTP